MHLEIESAIVHVLSIAAVSMHYVYMPILVCVGTSAQIHMWQSLVEVKHYSIAYFDCITTFKVLWHRTSVKDGVHACCIDGSGICASTQHV